MNDGTGNDDGIIINDNNVDGTERNEKTHAGRSWTSMISISRVVSRRAFASTHARATSRVSVEVRKTTHR